MYSWNRIWLPKTVTWHCFYSPVACLHDYVPSQAGKSWKRKTTLEIVSRFFSQISEGRNDTSPKNASPFCRDPSKEVPRWLEISFYDCAACKRRQKNGEFISNKWPMLSVYGVAISRCSGPRWSSNYNCCVSRVGRVCICLFATVSLTGLSQGGDVFYHANRDLMRSFNSPDTLVLIIFEWGKYKRNNIQNHV